MYPLLSPIRASVAALLNFGFASVAAAIVSLPPPFTEGAVLQRGRPIAVWGSAAPGEALRISFRDFETRTQADQAGHWSVKLPAMAATDVGSDLVVVGENKVSVRDVVLGDVWLCSGQSNMGRTVATEIQAGVKIDLETLPTIRHFEVQRLVAATPRATVEGTGWRPASPENAGAFSAIAYLFARDLARDLGVPIGIIHSSWGGTPIESWTDATIVASDRHPSFAGARAWWRNLEETYPALLPDFDRELAKWTLNGKPGREPKPPHGGTDDTWRPGALYNGMIHPLAPYGLCGVLWYQGETNAITFSAERYHPLFAAMIASWRDLFQQADLPFVWVQLPNYKTDKDWPGVREAQSDTLILPRTGQAVTIDIGDPNDIHPHNKLEVARRLALVAKGLVYGRRVPFNAPHFLSVVPDAGSLRVAFAHCEGGLVVRGDTVKELEVAGADKVFHPAEGRIQGSTLIVSSPHVRAPVAVRYAWSANPSANLYNHDGLPAAPFRSHRW